MCKKLIYLVSLILVVYSAVNAQANLVGHWQFDGNFNDSSGNSNDAMAHGDAAVVNDPERGQGAILDGSGDYIEIPHSNSLNITGEQISLAAWVYFDDVSGLLRLLLQRSSTILPIKAHIFRTVCTFLPTVSLVSGNQ